jgi:hypothetical protein
MTESKNLRELTVKPVHFPPVVIWTAGIVWGLSIVGALLEIVLGSH